MSEKLKQRSATVLYTLIHKFVRLNAPFVTVNAPIVRLNAPIFCVCKTKRTTQPNSLAQICQNGALIFTISRILSDPAGKYFLSLHFTVSIIKIQKTMIFFCFELDEDIKQ